MKGSSRNTAARKSGAGAWSTTKRTSRCGKPSLADNRADADGGPEEEVAEAEGGAIYASGPLALASVTLEGNEASAAGGPHEPGDRRPAARSMQAGSASNASPSPATSRSAEGGSGAAGGDASAGAINDVPSGTGAQLQMREVELRANTAEAIAGAGSGGGSALEGAMHVFSKGPAGAISGLTASENVAIAGGSGPGAATAEAGGIELKAGELAMTLTNATITDNTAQALGPGAMAEAGGLEASGGTAPVTIASSTIDANRAEGEALAAGGDLVFGGGVQVRETIVSAGTGQAGRENCYAPSPAVSLGHNLDSRDECGFNEEGDRVNTEPQLGPAAGRRRSASDPGARRRQPRPGRRRHERMPGNRRARGAQTPGAGVRHRRVRARAAVGEHRGGELRRCRLRHAQRDRRQPRRARRQRVLPVRHHRRLRLADAPGVAAVHCTVGGPTERVLRIGDHRAGGGRPGGFSDLVTGLAPGTVYHFRAVAVTPEGTAYGADGTFTTTRSGPSSVPPRPALTSARLRPSSLKPERGRGASFGRTRRRRGATLSYRDSLPATVTFTVQRWSPDSAAAGAARRRLRATITGQCRHCTRHVRVGGFSHADPGGAVRLRFTGRAARQAARGGPLPPAARAEGRRADGRDGHARLPHPRLSAGRASDRTRAAAVTGRAQADGSRYSWDS